MDDISLQVTTSHGHL